ncbi:hypothetical protein HanIR_Chr15g0747711 [Helianthus annuus]|nr:hypothetical protein HanIR_Chr15g0747711 [Helianthus annuus]
MRAKSFLKSSQKTLINLKFIPSGPGARSYPHSKTATLISSSMNSSTKKFSSTSEIFFRLLQVSSGLKGRDSLNLSRKKDRTCFLILVGFVHHSPLILRP